MTTVDMRRCWAPVDRRWRYIVAGDVIVSDDEDEPGLFPVVESRASHRGWRLEIFTGGDDEETQVHHGDPDEMAQVLVPARERDGLALVADELGGRVIA